MLLWWAYWYWFLQVFWILHDHKLGAFMPNSSVFIFLMLWALYRVICKSSKKQICKKEFECNKCKVIFNFSFSMFLAFLCLFGENDTLHLTYWVIFLPSGTSAASMTSTASTASVASMTSIASFHQKTLILK